MGILDAPQRPYRSADPVLSTPTIVDSPISIIGISRDRLTLIGATTVAPYQLHYSTDEATTWSAPLLGTAESNPILAAVETESFELILTLGAGTLIKRTTNWVGRTMGGGTMSATSVVSARASGVYVRPGWGLDARGEIALAMEYGAKSNSPLSNNARYLYISKDWGTKWFRIFDVINGSFPGIEGAGVSTAHTNGYHGHGASYDPWSGRIWVTFGDDDEGIMYSDDAAKTRYYPTASTTSASLTLTTSSSLTVFRPSDVGKSIRGNGIPDGTTITAVTNGYTITLSQNATATGSSNVAVLIGNITWQEYRYHQSGRFQVTGIIPAPEGIYFGADGYPTGVHFARRLEGGGVGPIENLLLTAPYSLGTGYHLQNCAFRARDVADPPILIGLIPTSDAGAGATGALVIARDGKAWKVWDGADTNPDVVGGFNFVCHTAQGNILGTLESTYTSSGRQLFKAPMPALPTTQVR